METRERFDDFKDRRTAAFTVPVFFLTQILIKHGSFSLREADAREIAVSRPSRVRRSKERGKDGERDVPL